MHTLYYLCHLCHIWHFVYWMHLNRCVVCRLHITYIYSKPIWLISNVGNSIEITEIVYCWLEIWEIAKWCQASTGSMSSSTGKRKEIYKYLAPWPLYSMNWSVRPDKRFRLALGSFIEEYNNKVQVISLDEDTSEFSAKRWVSDFQLEMFYFLFPYLINWNAYFCD